MPRPTNKIDLLNASEANFKKLLSLVEGLSEAQQEAKFDFEDRDKCVRDVLAHLYEWHLLLINFIQKNLSGERASFLPHPYNWKTYPQMNVQIWRKHQDTPLCEAKALLTQTHEKAMALTANFSDEELFARGYFNFTGNLNLAAYVTGSTSSHYDWAIKKIRKHKRSLKTSL